MAVDVVPSIAERYRVSVEAVREVERALRATGGTQAQFDHPDLGGPGQWMPGMVMTGRWDDHDLKRRVEGLCAEVAAVVRGLQTSAPEALAGDPSIRPTGSHLDVAAGEDWWPAALGRPGAAGSQNGVRYAYFPQKRRLLIQLGARIDAYDTDDHRISGISQRQGRSSALAFTSQHGEVPLDRLRCVPLV
jgi:hypothetical protein